MDPNAALKELEEIVLGNFACCQDVGPQRRIRELVEALDEWLSKGGFEPDWKSLPAGAGYFVAMVAQKNPVLYKKLSNLTEKQAKGWVGEGPNDLTAPTEVLCCPFSCSGARPCGDWCPLFERKHGICAFLRIAQALERWGR